MTKLFGCREDLVKTAAVITRTGLIVQLPTPWRTKNLTEFIARTGVQDLEHFWQNSSPERERLYTATNAKKEKKGDSWVDDLCLTLIWPSRLTGRSVLKTNQLSKEPLRYQHSWGQHEQNIDKSSACDWLQTRYRNNSYNQTAACDWLQTKYRNNNYNQTAACDWLQTKYRNNSYNQTAACDWLQSTITTATTKLQHVTGHKVP